MLKIIVLVLIGFFSFSQSKNRFMPNLPLGEYRVVFEKLYHCGSRKNHSFFINGYFSKKTSNTSELKGNITSLIPFDDTLTVDINFASWSSIGGWKPNSLVYISKKACSQTKKVLGNVWFTFEKGFNFSRSYCPIPSGTYITSGIDFKKLEDHNFPKVYFYGKYKVMFKLKDDQNRELSCEIIEINLLRPWEIPL